MGRAAFRDARTGIPYPSLEHSLGLFVGNDYGVAALNPPNSLKVVAGSAIVIDLAGVVLWVGERCIDAFEVM